MTLGLLIELLGIPPNAAEGGYLIDSLLELVHWFMLILIIGWGSFYAYAIYRFRKSKNPHANYYGVTGHLPTKIEGGILVLEVVLLLAFAAPIWAERVDAEPTGPDVVHIRVLGQQYAWNFQYAGPDGKLGARNADLTTSGNPIGVDFKHSKDADDDLVTTGEMHVPIGKQIDLLVGSRDVIHDFCVPSMRIAQDATPGLEVKLWFKPIRQGTYEIVCAQLCGYGHAAMRGTIVVEDQKTYDEWYKKTLAATSVGRK